MKMIYVVVCGWVGGWVGGSVGGCYNMPKTSAYIELYYNGTYCGESDCTLYMFVFVYVSVS